jgi:hypothetical protein
MDTEINLTVTTKGEKKPMTIKPQDMQGDLELTVDDASMDPANQEERISRHMAYVQQLQQLQAASEQQAQSTRWATSPVYLDFASLIDDYSQIMGHPNYDKLLLNKQAVDQAMQNSQTPMVMPNERINLTPGDLMASEIAQLLTRNGIQPDPSREQGALAPNELVMQADVRSTLAKSQPAEPAADTSGNITPEHMLAADAQAHQQKMDMINAAHQHMTEANNLGLKQQTQTDNTQTQRQGLMAKMRGGGSKNGQ